jgi:hypothetical protein
MNRKIKYSAIGCVLALAFVGLLRPQNSNRWVAIGQMQTARAGACSVQLQDGRVLITGGAGASGVLNSAELFDSTGSYTDVASMLYSHADHVCAALEDGRVLVAGGRLTGTTPSNIAEVYDPAKNTWSLAGTMMSARVGATASLLRGGRVLIAGGDSGSSVASLEYFDPSNNTFDLVSASLSAPRKNHAAAVLKDGRVLFAGGLNNGAPLDTVEVFDPKAGAIDVLGHMSVPRSALTATTLLDGKVLLAGGLGRAGDLAVVEVVDAEARTISITANMPTPRHGHQALRLKDNNAVLFVGGSSAGAAPEVYVPWKGVFKKFDDYKSKWARSKGSSGSTSDKTASATPQTASGGGVATIVLNQGARFPTDDPDFPPDMTVFVSGSGWQPGETVSLVFTETNGPDDPATYQAVADESGNISDSEFAPDLHDTGINFNLLASGQLSNLQASAAFTDSAASIEQCGNGKGGGQPCINNATYSNWVNGNLGASKSLYVEGDSIPYRMVMTGLTNGPHTLIIQWDTTKAGKHAIDYLTSWDRSAVAPPSPGSSLCFDLTNLAVPCAANSPSTLAIPVDTNLGATFGDKGAGGGTPIAGVFTLFGGTISGTSCPSGVGTCLGQYSLSAPYSGDSSTAIAINFTSTGPTAVLGWGGHIATRLDWGLANSAVSISGSPYHTRLISLDGGGGNQDRSLSADAVIFPGSITIIKNVTPITSGVTFPFTASPAPLADFNLDASNSSGATTTFGGITNFQTYTVTESATSGWQFNTVTCTVASANGGSSSTSGATATINMKEGEEYTCTYSNTEQGSIKIVKNTVGGDGTFGFTSNFGVSSIATTGNTGSQTVGNLTPGSTYTISETAQSGWNAGTFNCTAGTSAGITVTAGGTTTCTITNTQQGSIKIVKNTVGGDGTFGFTSNFGVSLIATASLTGSQTVNVSPGSSYSISETAQTGWVEGTFGCTNGIASAITVVAGQTTTCTITNMKQGSIKIVKNTVGGDGTFGFTSNFGVSSITTSGGTNSQIVNNLSAGNGYSISETAQTGWVEGAFSCTNGTASAITVVAGQTTTCTIQNTKQGQIIVKKVTNPSSDTTTTFSFVPNYETNFTLTNGNSNTSPLLSPNTYSVSESALTGWDSDGGTCNNGNPPSAIVLGAGQTVTCTFTNTQRGKAQVIKTVDGQVPGTDTSLLSVFEFNIRTGASTTSDGTVVADQSTSSGNGTLTFNNTLLVPGTYQMCEYVQPGFGTTVTVGGVPMPLSIAVPTYTGTLPAWLCTNFTVAAGQTVTFNVDNVKPSSNGKASTIGYWKNWSSCAKSNGSQLPILDQTLWISQTMSPHIPYSTGITLGKLVLTEPAGGTRNNAGTECQYAVNLLSKLTKDGKTKEASDPAFNLVSQLLGAILNVDAGAAIGLGDQLVINEAEILLANHDFDGTAAYLPFSPSEATLANALAALLDSYNNNQIDPSKVPPLITSPNSYTIVNSTLSSFSVTALGIPAPAITESGTLPAHFSFTPGTGTATLSYDGAALTPKKSYPITLTATNSSGTFIQSFTIIVP